MKLIKAVSVKYDRAKKTVTVTYADGSISSWPVRLLEMVVFTGDAWEPISPSDDELELVELIDGRSIEWDELGQSFELEDLENRVYGRKSWMEAISATC